MTNLDKQIEQLEKRAAGFKWQVEILKEALAKGGNETVIADEMKIAKSEWFKALDKIDKLNIKRMNNIFK